MTNMNRDSDCAATHAFNATGLMADSGNQKPWKRAALIAQAEIEFRRLRNLRPSAVFGVK